MARKKRSTVEDIQRSNWALYMERGPGIYPGFQTYIEARDRKARKVLIGGLGGVGSAWVNEYPGVEEKPGWEDAPEQAYPDGPFAGIQYGP